MSRAPTGTIDRSRAGHLIHEARASGRTVTVIAYLEGVEDPRYVIQSDVICRTSEQASEVARVLQEALFTQPARGGR